jgi:hypothetical protein
MRALAAEHGGKCLSNEYVNNCTRLEWQCTEGHRWQAKPNDIRRSWCPYCANTVKLEIADLRRIARERGGKLLSTTYINRKQPLLWRCRAGHTWQAPASRVKPGGYRPGTWCPLCPMRRKGQPSRLTIEEMREIAAQRGGQCLSSTYVNAATKLKWRCAEGHEWEAQPSSVKYGNWCRACVGGGLKFTLEVLQAEAAKRGGRLVSDEYVSSWTPVLWECAEGHQWKAAASNIRRGRWCPHCARKAPLTIAEMKELARSYGGECLSKTYVNKRTPLKWRCAKGHVWSAQPSTVKPHGYKERGSWCPECARAPIYTLDDMRQYAAFRGGKCLSRAYVNAETPLEWICASGHRWSASVTRLRPYSEDGRSLWCPICASITGTVDRDYEGGKVGTES